VEQATRQCDACGAVYDYRLRGVSGAFHFRVFSASDAGPGEHRLVGHWRTGVWEPGAALVLLRPDGSVTALRAAVLEVPSGVAGMRGQGVLIIEAEQPEAVQGQGCVVRR
jgi:hypothetical protein